MPRVQKSLAALDYPAPKPSIVKTELFQGLWSVMKNWKIGIEEDGQCVYTGAKPNHVAALMEVLRDMIGIKLVIRRQEDKNGFFYAMDSKNGGTLCTSKSYSRRATARRACRNLNAALMLNLEIIDDYGRKRASHEIHKVQTPAQDQKDR